MISTLFFKLGSFSFELCINIQTNTGEHIKAILRMNAVCLCLLNFIADLGVLLAFRMNINLYIVGQHIQRCYCIEANRYIISCTKRMALHFFSFILTTLMDFLSHIQLSRCQIVFSSKTDDYCVIQIFHPLHHFNDISWMFSLFHFWKTNTFDEKVYSFHIISSFCSSALPLALSFTQFFHFCFTLLITF